MVPSAREGVDGRAVDETAVFEAAGLFLATVKSGTGLGIERVWEEAILAVTVFESTVPF